MDVLNLKLFVDKKTLFRKLSEEDIYRRYSNDFPKVLCHSPFRKDNNPSFGFFHNGAKWLWKDQATGDAGNVIDFVARYYNTDFSSAVLKIYEDFNLDLVSRPVISDHVKNTKIQVLKKRIQVVDRPLTEHDYNLWAKWGISANTMNLYGIKAADSVWIYKLPDRSDIRLWAIYKNTNPIYYWLSPYSNNVKVYKPLEPDKLKKWRSTFVNETDFQGYYQCRIKEIPNRPLILTKSMKEVCFFRNFGINAMASNAENVPLHVNFVKHLYKYCHPIISVYDSDGPGIVGALKLKSLYQIPNIHLCNAYHKSKDPTDRWIEDYHNWYKHLDYIQEIIRYYDLRQFTPPSLRNT